MEKNDKYVEFFKEKTTKEKVKCVNENFWKFEE